MPRIRPLRTTEEVAKVPMDQSVVIDLSDQSNKSLDVKKDDKKPEELDLGRSNYKPEGQLEEPDHTIPEPKKPKKEAKPEQDEDDPSADLKAQLEDMRKAFKEAQDRANEAERLRQEAIKEAQKREAEARQHNQRAEDAEYDAILNAIAAAEADIERATVDLERAQADQDHKLIADATRRMSRAESRMVQLSDGKEYIERTRLQNKDKNPTTYEQEQPKLTVEQHIDQLPNLLPSQKTWLKEHPEVLTDQRKYQRLSAYHFEAEDKGLQPGTQRYFDYLNERLGYKQPEVDVDDEEDDEPTPRRSVQAPPSRGAHSPTTGKVQENNRITLTPKEREAAEIAGVDPLTYAKNLQKLRQLKSEGFYTNE